MPDRRPRAWRDAGQLEAPAGGRRDPALRAAGHRRPRTGAAPAEPRHLRGPLRDARQAGARGAAAAHAARLSPTYWSAASPATRTACTAIRTWPAVVGVNQS